MSIVELLAELTKREQTLEGKDRALAEQSAHIAELDTQAFELKKKLERAAHEREEYRKLYELTVIELERLRNRIFAKSSERVPEGQLPFAELVELLKGKVGEQNEDAAESAPRGEAEEASRPEKTEKKHKPSGRKPLPEDLPLVEITLLPLELSGKDRELYECMGEESSETVEHRSASAVRVRIIRPQFVKKGEPKAGVLTASPAEQPIERGLAGPAMLAKVVTDKFEDHQGLHRQQRRFEREGLHLSDSTLGGWLEGLHTLCDPLVLAMCTDSVKTCPFIATDATGVLVMAKEECRRGHFFVLLGGDKHVLFRYSKVHTSEAIRGFLAGYKGYIVADAHSIYDALYRNGCVEVACMAHARRYFYKSLGTDPERARMALAMIGKLFKIERDLKGATRTHKEKVRREKSQPVLDAFFLWCEQQRDDVLDETPIANAIRYALNQRVALGRFVEDGRLPMHNNDSERSLRQLVIGRRNWLFVGSDNGGHRAATFVSLIASAKLHGIEPYAYLRDLFCLLPSWPRNRVLELAPAYFKQTLQTQDAQKRLAQNIYRAVSLGQPLETTRFVASA